MPAPGPAPHRLRTLAVGHVLTAIHLHIKFSFKCACGWRQWYRQKCGIVRKSQSVLMMSNGGLSALRPGPFGGGLRRLWLAGASSVRALPRARCLPRTVTLATRFLRCQRGAARSFRLPCVCPHRAGGCRWGATRVVCVCVEWRPNYLTTERAANADTRSTMSSAVGGKEDRSIWSSTGASSNRSRPHGPLRSAISS